MKATLKSEQGEILAVPAFDEPVHMCDGDTLTVTWKLDFSNKTTCFYCGKKLNTEKEAKLIPMTKVGDAYYHLCSLRCRILTALQGH
jgi:hypothetical protein